jgi:hypothetical protein
MPGFAVVKVLTAWRPWLSDAAIGMVAVLDRHETRSESPAATLR